MGFVELRASRAALILRNAANTLVALLTLHVDDGLLLGSAADPLFQKAQRDINQKLKIDVDSSERIMVAEDFLNAVKYLLNLKKGDGTIDDIDHLGSRRVRAVGGRLARTAGARPARVAITIAALEPGVACSIVALEVHDVAVLNLGVRPVGARAPELEALRHTV